jgi:hypothetical protein
MRTSPNGQTVAISVAGETCVVLRRDIFERGEMIDLSAWTQEEMDHLAAEAADLLAGDGFDEPLNS